MPNSVDVGKKQEQAIVRHARANGFPGAELHPLLQFRVYGQPGAQGSKRHVGKGHMVESSKKVKPWRTDVKAAAEAAMAIEWQPYAGAVNITVVFVFPRPKSHYRTGRNAHLLRDNAPLRPVGKNVGDLDKLLRSTFDALTAASAWFDDSQVTDVHAAKIYGERPGARITIQPAGYVPDVDWDAPIPNRLASSSVRLTVADAYTLLVADAYTLLRAAGYGTPNEEA